MINLQVNLTDVKFEYEGNGQIMLSELVFGVDKLIGDMTKTEEDKEVVLDIIISTLTALKNKEI